MSFTALWVLAANSGVRDMTIVPQEAFDWEKYNRRVRERLGGIAAAEAAARAYSPKSAAAPPEHDDFEFRHSLPGPGGYSAYRHRSTGETHFLKYDGRVFIELRESVRVPNCERPVNDTTFPAEGARDCPQSLDAFSVHP